jgi:hypothetical protein
MSTAHEVGGDFYDYFWNADGMLWCVIGDVADKGISAALSMARCVSLIHVTASHLGPDGRTRSPAQVMTLVNEELCRGNATMTYVTAVIARMIWKAESWSGATPATIRPTSCTGLVRWNSSALDMASRSASGGPSPTRMSGSPLAPRMACSSTPTAWSMQSTLGARCLAKDAWTR